MQVQTRQRGNCSMLAGKSSGGTPFCRMLKIGFPKSRIFCKAFPLQLFYRNSCKIVTCCFWETRRGGLVRPASKSCRFSHHPLRVPKAWHGDFAACGQRSGLLALNLASIFEKLLDQKTFICLRLVVGNLTFRETTRIRFGKAVAHPRSVLFAPQMWAARPHLASIFEKLLHRKTFICLRLVLQNTSCNHAIGKERFPSIFYQK